MATAAAAATTTMTTTTTTTTTTAMATTSSTPPPTPPPPTATRTTDSLAILARMGKGGSGWRWFSSWASVAPSFSSQLWCRLRCFRPLALAMQVAGRLGQGEGWGWVAICQCGLPARTPPMQDPIPNPTQDSEVVHDAFMGETYCSKEERGLGPGLGSGSRPWRGCGGAASDKGDKVQVGRRKGKD
ncbi:unnamed protein product [Discosporangium mesarthrocarpum]